MRLGSTNVSNKFSHKKKEVGKTAARARPPSPKPEVLTRIAGRLPVNRRHLPAPEMEASEAIAEMEHQANTVRQSGDENQDNSPGKRKQVPAGPAGKRQRVPAKAAPTETETARPRRTTARYV